MSTDPSMPFLPDRQLAFVLCTTGLIEDITVLFVIPIILLTDIIQDDSMPKSVKPIAIIKLGAKDQGYIETIKG
ncbi:Putative protein [Zobellia galactanivorans]|uniref:Uncharacterized protein n=1 Tax=Zobellia galactanivorans (strain DSM 12802 / CCUG 47099 / CIP 106680 / NCIMB 13871 / Dsij) TaxID=63186 RepID=G0L7Q5_ZOBGA|nr:Putative protein [Zobellia galactanivorans]